MNLPSLSRAKRMTPDSNFSWRHPQITAIISQVQRGRWDLQEPRQISHDAKPRAKCSNHSFTVHTVQRDAVIVIGIFVHLSIAIAHWVAKITAPTSASLDSFFVPAARNYCTRARKLAWRIWHSNWQLHQDIRIWNYNSEFWHVASEWMPCQSAGASVNHHRHIRTMSCNTYPVQTSPPVPPSPSGVPSISPV